MYVCMHACVFTSAVSEHECVGMGEGRIESGGEREKEREGERD